MSQINPQAIHLLVQARFLEPEYFMCFGRYYHQLKKLELIDGEYNLTYLGKQFVKYCIDEGIIND